jgi:hypothetical protein
MGELTDQMLDAYVKATGNITILERALPLASVSLYLFTLMI